MYLKGKCCPLFLLRETRQQGLAVHGNFGIRKAPSRFFRDPWSNKINLTRLTMPRMSGSSEFPSRHCFGSFQSGFFFKNTDFEIKMEWNLSAFQWNVRTKAQASNKSTLKSGSLRVQSGTRQVHNATPVQSIQIRQL
jgi:hypothetical protein